MDMHTKKIEKQKVSENTSKWCNYYLCLFFEKQQPQKIFSSKVMSNS